MVEDGHEQAVKTVEFELVKKFLEVVSQMNRMGKEFSDFNRPECTEIVGIQKLNSCVISV